MPQLFKRALAATLLLLVGCSAVSAHTYHAIRTTISQNENSGTVEIVHRAFAADVSALLAAEQNKAVEISDSNDHQQWLQSYWNRYFALLDSNKKDLPLSWVGVEVDDHYVWVYQEYQGNVKTLMEAQLHNGLLMGKFDHQINTVDVKLDSHKAALVFTETNLRQPLLAPPAQSSHHHH
ncbi:hypothetical protein K0504_02190 [Neiella marina]|uniref:Uncharacterized protein n=1 Tax=Neiella holothuriorum TaxID=2870530 RepID=A0ABS7EBX7_9GAMM|nr:DUF6702 family protein [Neiella holothuriorum]MBW8189831.1 hypothetical protein [Neiella holothuriorum]